MKLKIQDLSVHKTPHKEEKIAHEVHMSKQMFLHIKKSCILQISHKRFSMPQDVQVIFS